MLEPKGLFHLLEVLMAYDRFIETTAILVDGGFYRRRAYNLFGNKNARECAAYD